MRKQFAGFLAFCLIISTAGFGCSRGVPAPSPVPTSSTSSSSTISTTSTSRSSTTASSTSSTASTTTTTILHGAVWRQEVPAAAFSARESFTSVVFDASMWVIGGYVESIHGLTNDAWSSSNGANWTPAVMTPSFPPIQNAQSLVYDAGHGARIWIIGGDNNDGVTNEIWSAGTGMIWTLATPEAAFSPRIGFGAAELAGRMWVIGGQGSGFSLFNDSWSSSDGINWTQEKQHAAFSPRSYFSTVVFNDGGGDKMWVIGGIVSPAVTNDVWSSTNGSDWVRATPEAAFSPRYSPISYVYDNKIWVVGGADEDDLSLNDVWYSSNGVNWFQATTEAVVPQREYGSGVVYDNKMWLMGGFDDGDGWQDLNDVWYSQ